MLLKVPPEPTENWTPKFTLLRRRLSKVFEIGISKLPLVPPEKPSRGGGNFGEHGRLAKTPEGSPDFPPEESREALELGLRDLGQAPQEALLGVSKDFSESFAPGRQLSTESKSG